MAFSPSPYFVRVLYNVAGLPHVMEVPLHLYTPPEDGFPLGTIGRWDGSSAAADTLIEPFLTGLADLFTTDASFDAYLLYTQASPTDEPLLRAGKNIAIPGTMTITTGEEHLAIQVTFNFQTTLGNAFRVQLMEANSRNAYRKITNEADLTADEQNILAAVLAVTAWQAGRDGAQPNIWRSRTCTENEKLRRARHYT